MAKNRKKPSNLSETNRKINMVRGKLETIRDYKGLMRSEGLESDLVDKERESKLIVQLIRLERKLADIEGRPYVASKPNSKGTSSQTTSHKPKTFSSKRTSSEPRARRSFDKMTDANDRRRPSMTPKRFEKTTGPGFRDEESRDEKSEKNSRFTLNAPSSSPIQNSRSDHSKPSITSVRFEKSPRSRIGDDTSRSESRGKNSRFSPRNSQTEQRSDSRDDRRRPSAADGRFDQTSTSRTRTRSRGRDESARGESPMRSSRFSPKTSHADQRPSRDDQRKSPVVAGRFERATRPRSRDESSRDERPAKNSRFSSNSTQAEQRPTSRNKPAFNRGKESPKAFDRTSTPYNSARGTQAKSKQEDGFNRFAKDFRKEKSANRAKPGFANTSTERDFESQSDGDFKHRNLKRDSLRAGQSIPATGKRFKGRNSKPSTIRKK